MKKTYKILWQMFNKTSFDPLIHTYIYIYEMQRLNLLNISDSLLEMVDVFVKQ